MMMKNGGTRRTRVRVILAVVFTVLMGAAFVYILKEGITGVITGEVGQGLFNSYVDVILEDEVEGGLRFVAVDYSTITRKIPAFESDPVTVFVTGEDAYSSVSDGKHVECTLINPALYDDSGAAVQGDDVTGALLRRAATLDAAVRRVRILRAGERYFAEITVYIDKWENNAFYEYRAADDSLLFLGSFPNEKVVGLIPRG